MTASIGVSLDLIAALASGNLFTMDFSPTTDERAGWFAAMPETGGQFTRTRIERSGPNGQDCYEIVQHHVRGKNAGDFYWGWSDRAALALPASGETRYFRWRLWYSPKTNFAGLEQRDGASGAPIRNKMLILGDGSSIPNSRFILQADGDPSQGVAFVLQKDGGVDAAPSRRYTRYGVWMDIQLRVRYSSDWNTRDGGYDLWIDNNKLDATAASKHRIVMNLPDSKMMRMGYMNNALAERGTHTFRVCEFEVGTTFDSNWDK